MATKKHPLKWSLGLATLALGTITLFASLTGRAHATIYSFTTIDVPGATSTSAYGINDSGQIVGSYNNNSHGFLDTAGTFTTIDVPGAFITVASGINNSSQIVGYSVCCSPFAEGFLDTAGTFTTVAGTGRANFPNGINNSGQIFGKGLFLTSVGSGFLNAALSAQDTISV
jgi:uncharacterized membrane protein